MANADEASRRAALEKFLAAYRRDLERDALRSRDAYLAMFPGFESDVGAEFDVLEPDSQSQSQSEAEAEAESESESESGATPRPIVRGETIGPYRILDELGRGGQAVVYRAEHRKLGRQVALKVLQARALDLGSDSQIRRFRREAEVTARLDHPGICSVFETGHEGDVAWIAMRLVRGETLAQKIAGEARPPSGSSARGELTATVELCEKVARALHTAHEQGLVHRDVKPGNVMVQNDGEPVVLDFGMAREAGSDEFTLTRPGDLLGTPYYMSPEQLLPERGHVDRRTDVYSLGVVLYECVTLRRPFDAPSREALWQKILANDPEDPRRINPAIPRELALVIATAIHRDRDRRYQTALDLALDLYRVRAREPIDAKPMPVALRVRRWVQRNPAVATFLVLVSVGLVVTFALLAAVAREKTATQAALQRARALNLTAESDRALAQDVTLALLLAREAVRLDTSVETISQLQRVLVEPHPIAFLPRPETPATSELSAEWIESGSPERWWASAEYSADGRRIVTVAMDGGTIALCDAGAWDSGLWDAGASAIARRLEPITVIEPGPQLSSCTVAPRGDRLLVTSGVDRALRVHDQYGATLALVTGVTLSAWCGENAFVFGADGSAQLLDRDGARRANLRTAGSDRAACISTDADHLAAAFGDGSLIVWDRDGRELGHFPGLSGAELPEHVTLSMSARRAAAILRRPDARSAVDPGTGRAVLWDLDAAGVPCKEISAGMEISAGTVAPWLQIAFAPDGRRFVAQHLGPRARMFSSDGEHLIDLVAPGAAATVAHPEPRVRWSPSGDRVLTMRARGAMTLWTAEGAHVHTEEGPFSHASFAPDGRILCAGTDGATRLFDPDGNELMTVRGDSADVDDARFASDGDTFLTLCYSGVRVWRTAGRGVPRSMLDQTAATWIATSHDKVVTGSPLACAWFVWDRATGTLLQTLAIDLPPRLRGTSVNLMAAALSPDGRFLVTGAAHLDDHTARLWDLSTGALLQRFEHEPGGLVRRVRFAADGRRILTASWDGTARLWSVAGEEQCRFDFTGAGRPVPVWSADLSRDGKLVVTGHVDGVCRLWRCDGPNGVLLRELGRGGGGVLDVVFSPAGTRVLVGHLDARLRMFDVDGTHVMDFVGHEHVVSCVAFAPDGRTVASASADGTARLWHTDGRPIAVLRPSPATGVGSNKLACLSITPDGHDVYTVGIDRRVRLWFAQTEELLEHAAARAAIRELSANERAKYATLLE